MDISAEERRGAFSYWLRTGRLAAVRSADGVEVKFNPYHDPRNGQFTFAPGDGHSNNYVSRRPLTARTAELEAGKDATDTRSRSAIGQDPTRATLTAHQMRPPARPEPMFGRGGNSRAFEDPMTLEQAFPGLSAAPAGAILTAANSFIDLTGPAGDAQIALVDNWSREIVSQIKAVDPNWHYDRLGPVNSVEGRINEFNDLRFQRAAVFLRVRGDVGPLQVETLRFLQQRTDHAYASGKVLLEAGRLKPRLSDQEALGNYVDREVRRDMRARFNSLEIDAAGKGPVRVNRREDDSSGTDVTYRRPDARVGNVAFDVTLSHKTLATAQVRGFFNADFLPSRVVIIRPSQLGNGHTYVISRPEAKR